MVQAFVSFKSGGVAFILAFFFGLFFFNGVGHMYIGKVRRGVGILILGWFIYAILFVFLLSSFIPIFMQLSHSNDNATTSRSNSDLFLFRNNSHDNDLSHPSFFSFFSIPLFGVLYLLYLIIQAADANRLAKKFNLHLDKTGELLWY
ncbi:MAG: hypothetical protein ABJB76_07725 [Candidatus Nitrosocosmicus sp.]